MLAKVISDLILNATAVLEFQVASLKEQLRFSNESVKKYVAELEALRTTAQSERAEHFGQISKMEEEQRVASDKIFQEADMYKKEAEVLRLQLEEARALIVAQGEPATETEEIEGATVVKIEKKKRKR